jgi:hypothetical protein
VYSARTVPDCQRPAPLPSWQDRSRFHFFSRHARRVTRQTSKGVLLFHTPPRSYRCRSLSSFQLAGLQPVCVTQHKPLSTQLSPRTASLRCSLPTSSVHALWLSSRIAPSRFMPLGLLTLARKPPLSRHLPFPVRHRVQRWRCSPSLVAALPSRIPHLSLTFCSLGCLSFSYTVLTLAPGCGLVGT